MKSFWGSFLGTLVGVIVTTILIFLLFVAIMVAYVSQLSLKDEKIIKVKDNSVLHVKFENEIPERSSKNPFENFSFGGDFEKPNTGLNDILSNIEKAKDDDNIKGIYLDIASIPAGIATLEEIRGALIDFK